MAKNASNSWLSRRAAIRREYIDHAGSCLKKPGRLDRTEGSFGSLEIETNQLFVLFILAEREGFEPSLFPCISIAYKVAVSRSRLTTTVNYEPDYRTFIEWPISVASSDAYLRPPGS